MSKRRHNFGTKRFKEKSLFIFHARIALKSLILLFVRLIARGARNTHTDNKYCNPRACAPRVNNNKRVREHAHLIHVHVHYLCIYIPTHIYIADMHTKEVSKCTVTS